MRIQLVLISLFVLILQLQAYDLKAQRLTLNARSIALEDVLKEMTRQTGYDFLYNPALLKRSALTVTISGKDTPLEKILADIFEKQPKLSYTVDQKTVIIRPKRDEVASKEPTAFQERIIKGSVTNEKGEPLPGVSIHVKGTSKGTTTDSDGAYVIAVDKVNSMLVFSYVGFTTQEISTRETGEVFVVLKELNSDLNEVVVVGYGTQQKGSLTSAISSVKGEELLKTPSTNISSILGGRVSGLASLQESGEPGADKASLKIRGSIRNAIYVVDGIPRSIDEVDPNDIESVSILKDAAAASVYGLGASGGVVIVTTKKGNVEKPKIAYNASVGASLNANFPKFMDGPQFAHYYNMADMMDRLANGSISDRTEYVPVFTRKQLGLMTNNDPTDGWDNINYIDKVFGKGINQRHSLTVSGGSENTTYFTSVGYLGQEGNIENFQYRRYNARTNIETKLANNFKVILGMAGYVDGKERPGFAAGGTDSNPYFGEQGWLSVARQTIAMHPYLPIEHDGLYTSTAVKNTGRPHSPLAAIYESGKFTTRATNLQTNLALEYEAPWLKGLILRVKGAYDNHTYKNKNLSVPYNTMMINYPSSTSSDFYYTRAGDPREQFVSLGESQTTDEFLVGQVSSNYKNTFGQVHDVELLLLGETRDWKSSSFAAYSQELDFPELGEIDLGNPRAENPVTGSSNHTRAAGLVFRAKYAYDNKYLTEFSGRYDGSYKLSGNTSGKRWGFFPSASLAWRLSKENFMSNLTFINDLKIRGSVGLLGDETSINGYGYLSTYDFNDSKVFLNGNAANALYTNKIENPNLTWEKVLSQNIGFDANMWNGLLSVEFDYFYNYRYDMLTAASGQYSPSMGGYYLSFENYNRQETRGAELLLRHKNKTNLRGKSFTYWLSGTISSAKSKWLRYRGDAAKEISYKRYVNSNVYAVESWLAEGLYRSEEEIDNSAWYGGRPNVGDIKYTDINGDGVIDRRDRGRFGRPNMPELTFGFNIGGEWNGFDIDLQFVGGARFDVSMLGTYHNYNDDNTIWTQTFKEGSNSPLYLVQNAYSIDNPNGSFPRITLGSAGSGGYNNIASSFWFRDGKYVRLKSTQIGYAVPTDLLNKIGVSHLRVFVEGSNLLTISGLPEGLDPESPRVNNGYYPQQRTFMGGLTLTF